MFTSHLVRDAVAGDAQRINIVLGRLKSFAILVPYQCRPHVWTLKTMLIRFSWQAHLTPSSLSSRTSCCYSRWRRRGHRWRVLLSCRRCAVTTKHRFAAVLGPSRHSKLSPPVACSPCCPHHRRRYMWLLPRLPLQDCAHRTTRTVSTEWTGLVLYVTGALCARSGKVPPVVFFDVRMMVLTHHTESRTAALRASN